MGAIGFLSNFFGNAFKYISIAAQSVAADNSYMQQQSAAITEMFGQNQALEAQYEQEILNQAEAQLQAQKKKSETQSALIAVAIIVAAIVLVFLLTKIF